jgi:hypothetical protein
MHLETTDPVTILDHVVRSRPSVGAFRPDPVPIAVAAAVTTGGQHRSHRTVCKPTRWNRSCHQIGRKWLGVELSTNARVATSNGTPDPSFCNTGTGTFDAGGRCGSGDPQAATDSSREKYCRRVKAAQAYTDPSYHGAACSILTPEGSNTVESTTKAGCPASWRTTATG